MDYDLFREQIRTGDLLAWSTHKTTGSRRIINTLIRLFTVSEYAHVGIAWVVGDRVFVIEAVRPMVRIFPLSSKIPFYHVNTGLNVSDGLLTYMLSRVGESYSISQAIAAYFSRPKADKEWQCAELVNDIFRRGGLKLRNAWTPSSLVSETLNSRQQARLTLVAR